jgi:hypothetical protein
MIGGNGWEGRVETCSTWGVYGDIWRKLASFFASSREKKSGENDASSWCPFLCVSNYVGSQNVSCEKV